jgi:hypothetical protein
VESGQGVYWKKFRVARVNYDEVAPRADGISGERSVSRADFEKLYSLWDRYKQGKVSQAETVRRSQNTTYVFSLLHWFEEQDGRTRLQ